MKIGKKRGAKPGNKCVRFGKATLQQLKCYQLCYFKGLTQQKAAEQLNLTSPAVCSALKRLEKNYPKLFPICSKKNPVPVCKKKIKYRGVYYQSISGGFRCEAAIYLRINRKDKRVSLGCFKIPEQAAKAYDKKAKEIWGKKAILNFGHYKTISLFQMKVYKLCSGDFYGFTQRQTATILGISQQAVCNALKILKKNYPILFPLYGQQPKNWVWFRDWMSDRVTVRV